MDSVEKDLKELVTEAEKPAISAETRKLVLSNMMDYMRANNRVPFTNKDLAETLEEMGAPPGERVLGSELVRLGLAFELSPAGKGKAAMYSVVVRGEEVSVASKAVEEAVSLCVGTPLMRSGFEEVLGRIQNLKSRIRENTAAIGRLAEENASLERDKEREKALLTKEIGTL